MAESRNAEQKGTPARKEPVAKEAAPQASHEKKWHWLLHRSRPPSFYFRTRRRSLCSWPGWLPIVLFALLAGYWTYLVLVGDFDSAGTRRRFWWVTFAALYLLALLLFWVVRRHPWAVWIGGRNRVSLSRFQAVTWLMVLATTFLVGLLMKSIVGGGPGLLPPLEGILGPVLSSAGALTGAGVLGAVKGKGEPRPEAALFDAQQRFIMGESIQAHAVWKAARGKGPTEVLGRYKDNAKLQGLLETARSTPRRRFVMDIQRQASAMMGTVDAASMASTSMVGPLGKTFEMRPERGNNHDHSSYCHASLWDLVLGDEKGAAYLMDGGKVQFLLLSLGAALFTAMGIVDQVVSFETAKALIDVPVETVAVLGASTLGYLGLKTPPTRAPTNLFNKP